MDDQKRINHAWDEAQDWIIQFDGAPQIALFTDAPRTGLADALGSLAGQTENFRITQILAGQAAAAEFIPIEGLGAALERLWAGELEELSWNCALRRDAFDLDLRAVIHPMQDVKTAIEVFWWSDQVFSEETDNPVQFHALAAELLAVQRLLGAGGIFMSRESGSDPREDPEAWTEL